MLYFYIPSTFKISMQLTEGSQLGGGKRAVVLELVANQAYYTSLQAFLLITNTWEDSVLIIMTTHIRPLLTVREYVFVCDRHLDNSAIGMSSFCEASVSSSLQMFAVSCTPAYFKPNGFYSGHTRLVMANRTPQANAAF